MSGSVRAYRNCTLPMSVFSMHSENPGPYRCGGLFALATGRQVIETAFGGCQ